MLIKNFILFIFLAAAILPQEEVIDKIVAVVDNEIILQSELDFQAAMYASQRGVDPDNPELKRQLLNSMIDEKLVYAQSEIDSIIITDEEVVQRIDYQISVLQQQYGTIANIEQMYGMSIEKIKRELREDVRKNLMVQRLREKNFTFLEASRREVEEFFSNYKDSLGMIPEKLTIFHIFRNPKTTDRLKKRYRDFAQAVLDSIKQGGSFEEFAKKYSEDPGSKAYGGDLGFVKRGVFYPEFEAAAFSLNEGELSGVVESPVGYHIIELIERRGESIHTRHILIKFKTDENADLETIEFLTDVRDSIINSNGNFREFAKIYSEDKETAPYGGELGTFFVNQVDKQLLDAVSKLEEGEISFPRRIEYGQDTYGYHIVFLKSRIPQHPPSLDDDYSEIKRLADEFKKQKEYEEWINELKTKIYWEVRI
ncbi:MAG: peptidylprolyl isomerase [Ignavibacteria bacterium]|nr:peptidylprolyl isomerase [Ignavibacteria bacterium]MBT8381952.1 peptidylprolyl isomerase [Ignavibacteria bacterium]MBT8392789.1 peptidylprolyl isomerase [Ignavibacteria bacterium]NNJ54350.1 parvulin peptidyl-prolyl isomerase [Ignavibacteriaceae bacterium]NNL20533.1 parvulin peptidyl-prolyl isomerase [Ignavibacteriaceae bacterium]